MTNCSKCKFFSALDGTCHIKPPQAALIPSQKGPQVVSFWPAIAEPDRMWCGEGQLDSSLMAAVA